MPDDYQPQTAFEGYVKASIDYIKERLNALPCDESNKRLNKCETEIANIKGKTSIIGAVAGGVAGLITKIFLNK